MIGSDVDGLHGKTHAMLDRELALMSKAGAIDAGRGNIRVVDLADDEPRAEAAECDPS
jgi:hypothetical protein